MIIRSFSEQFSKLVKEISHRREEIKTDFCRAYLASIIPNDVDLDSVIQKLELVEKWDYSKSEVKWFFQLKK